MTNEEAIAIIRQEYLCVDKDCGIERSCGKCDLAMPSKEPILEAYDMAIEALSVEPCEDCVSRHEVMCAIGSTSLHYELARRLRKLQPVTQQLKIGYWRHYDGMLYCSKCGAGFYDDIMEYCGDDAPKYCPDCGQPKMFEPQESEEV